MNNPYMPLYTGDYLRDTMQLSLEEHGAYLLLLVHYWNNGPFPLDFDDMARVCRVESSALAQLWKKVGKYFTVDNGTVYSHRMDIEREKAVKFHESRVSAGLKGGRPRKTESPTKAQLKLSLSSTKAQPKLPIPIPNTIERDNSAGAREDDSKTSETTTPDSIPPEAHVPTLAEVETEASMRGIKPETAKAFWAHNEGNQLWKNQFGKLTNWRLKLKTWSENERGNNTKSNHKPGADAHDPFGRNTGTCNDGVKIARKIE